MAGLTVRPHEQGVIRLFTLDLPERDLKRLTSPGRTDPSPQATVAMLVGLDWLEEGGFEIFEPEVLGDLGLAGYLVEGGGVAEADLAADTARLNAIETPVLVVYSRAFGGAAASLVPGPALTHVGTWVEDRPAVAFETLSSDAARGLTGAPDTPPARVGPHLTVLLAILALPLAVLLAVGLFLLVRG